MKTGSSLAVGALIVVLPIVVFAVAVGVVLATHSENAPTAAAVPSVTLNVRVDPTVAPASSAANPPAAAAVSPSPATTPVNRTSCSAIRGTTYQSDEERAWFLQNCPAPTAVPGTATTARTVSAPSSTTQASGAIYGTADRLVISRLAINAPVNIRVVGQDGTMGNPIGANDVVLYDFSAVPGLGGYPGSGGNTVIAGHVDYICCLAVFAPLRNIQEGDVIDYYTADGTRYRYVVQWFGDYPPETNWASIVGGGPDIMTLITCNGTFDTGAHEYSHRRVVRAALVQS